MEGEVVKDETKRIYHNETTRACHVLMELRNAGELCDAEILVGNTSFPIHRVILSSSSTYFRVLFTNERFQSNRQKVIIPNVSVNTMNSILEFAYTQECSINCNNVEDLLVAADYFNMIRLLQCCCEFLATGLTAENCVGIRRLAQIYSCRELQLAAHRYILQNFSIVYRRSDEFQRLNIDDICEIISSDCLNVKSEEIVFDGIVDWISYDPNKRKHHFNRLLQKVRFELTSACFIEQVQRYCCACGEDFTNNLFHIPVTFSPMEAIDRSHVSLPTARIPNQILFVIGGWSGGSPTGIIETYDIRADRWIECPSVNSGSCHVSVAIIGLQIYALGGFNGQTELKSAERYNHPRNQWTLIQDMNYQRSDAGATALNDILYICGGFSGQQYLNCAEFYSPKTNQWTLIAPMNSIRCGLSIIAYCDFIYALGGFSGVTRVTSAERYDPSVNKWQSIETMSIPRSNFAATILDDKVFVIGGVADENSIYNVEYYDIVTEKWHNVSHMNIHRRALSACVLEGLPNTYQYIAHRHQSENSGKQRAINKEQ
uniref:BTB domain-containing protein n=2 Tax=Octopus bimaculoides TaxID=37653 RepID=A0A0L8GDM9_OCTBM